MEKNMKKTFGSLLSVLMLLSVSLSYAQKTIEIDGSSTVYPITEAVAEDFQNANADVKVTVGISGTGGGFKRFVVGELDISDASRPIDPKEVEAAKANGIEFIELPIAYDGLAIVVNPKNTWVDHLTIAELKKMWEPAAQGKIMKWNQIRPEWPDKEMHLFGAGTDSGTYEYFTEAAVGQKKASRGDFTPSEDDNIIVQGVASD
jgi:phosphate transport system substrate-binding protein